MDNDEIVYADKDYRKKMIIGFILVALATAVFLHYSTAYIDQLFSEKKRDNQFKAVEDAFSFILILRGVLTIVFTAVGIYWISIGLRILNSKRFPPPGMKVLKDTKIKKGRSATAMAYILFVGAVIIVIATNFAFWYMHRAFDRIKKNHFETHELIKENKAAHNHSVQMNADQR